MKLTVPVLRHSFSTMDMQTLLSTCRPASFVQLTLGEDELQDKVDGLFRWYALGCL